MGVIGKAILKGLIGLLVFFAALYFADFVVWRVRSAHGGAIATVLVRRTVVASLKGNREEYYTDGSQQLDCSESLFQQYGSGACWYLRRHRFKELR